MRRFLNWIRDLLPVAGALIGVAWFLTAFGFLALYAWSHGAWGVAIFVLFVVLEIALLAIERVRIAGGVLLGIASVLAIVLAESPWTIWLVGSPIGFFVVALLATLTWRARIASMQHFPMKMQMRSRLDSRRLDAWEAFSELDRDDVSFHREPSRLDNEALLGLRDGTSLRRSDWARVAAFRHIESAALRLPSAPVADAVIDFLKATSRVDEGQLSPLGSTERLYQERLSESRAGASVGPPYSQSPRPIGLDPPRPLSPIQCTVFAPDRIRRGDQGLLQVLLHAREHRELAQEMASRYDKDTVERGHQSLPLDVANGATLLLEVEIEGFHFERREALVVWSSGSIEAHGFGFVVPKGCKFGTHIGTAWVSVDGLPVGRIDFKIEVASDTKGARMVPTGHHARRYRRCFCSYASEDRAEALKRAQGVRAAVLEIFVDVLSLRPGEAWSDKVFEEIDASDLFVVMWSHNALASEWVLKETRYALERRKQHRSPDFRPIPIEGPPIAPVPQDLQATHFNDALLHLIRAADVRN